MENNLIPFQAYQVGILHPDTWNIFMNPSKSFTFYDGFVKIDQSTEKFSTKQATISLRWAKLKKETSIDEYIDEVKLQYERKSKKNKKDQFHILSIEPLENMPHKSFIMHSSIHANHAIYRSLRREEQILSMQATTYCDVTNRIVIASISALPELFATNQEKYKKILSSLSCH